MGIVSSTGIGSGIDIQSLAIQLAKAETQPALNSISRQTDSVSTRLSGLGSLKSALSTFKSALTDLKDGSVFSTYKVSSSDESILTASAGTGSTAGSYALEVTQLAKAQKSIATSEFADSSALVGSGTLSFQAASGDSFDLTVGATTSLIDLRDAINQASGNSFVTASIINVDNATSTGTISKLVLTAKQTGSDNAFTVSGSDDDGNNTDASGLSRLFSGNLSTQVSAQDAIVKIDGQTATRSSNTITDLLAGVTLDLQSANVGTTVDLNVSLDNDAIQTAIGNFVDAYNKFSSTTQSLGKYGGATDGSGAGNGPLIGDSTLRLISSQIRQNASATVSSITDGYNSLAMIGISIKDGTMSLDSAKLEEALAANSDSVSNVFASSDGVAVRLYDLSSNFLQSGGTLDSQQNSLNKQLSALAEKKLDVEDQQASVQEMLLKQFTAMDVAVGTFNSTGSFLTNWLNSLN